jgi:cysteine desulfurase
MLPFFTEKYGNSASRNHGFGWEAEEAVEKARTQVAAVIGADAKEIVFTSGATEADNLALKGVAEMYREKGDHIISVPTEHKAIIDTAKHLESLGLKVTWLPVDKEGLIDLDELRRSITEKTILISVMAVNNEVGVIQPLAEIGKIAAEKGVLFHTDAVQAVGKIPIDVNAMGIHLLSMSGHKIYGPKGIGALYVRRGVRVNPVLIGSAREGGRRPGTENVLGIVGLGKAMELAARDLADRAAHSRVLRDRLHAELEARVPGLLRHGNPDRALPNTLSVSFPGVTGPALLAEAPDIAASAGAACHSGTVHVSATLAAMGVTPERAMGTVRLSTGRLLTKEQVDRAIEVLVSAFARLSLPSGGEKRDN